MVSRALSWMLHEMSAAGLLQKNKACLDALPRAYWYHEGCAAVAAALSRLLGQEQLSMGTALPGKPPLLIPRGLFLLSGSGTFPALSPPDFLAHSGNLR